MLIYVQKVIYRRTDGQPKTIVRNLTKIEFFIFSRYDLYLDAFDLDKKFLTIQKFNFYDSEEDYILVEKMQARKN